MGNLTKPFSFQQRIWIHFQLRISIVNYWHNSSISVSSTSRFCSLEISYCSMNKDRVPLGASHFINLRAGIMYVASKPMLPGQQKSRSLFSSLFVEYILTGLWDAPTWPHSIFQVIDFETLVFCAFHSTKIIVDPCIFVGPLYGIKKFI